MCHTPMQKVMIPPPCVPFSTRYSVTFKLNKILIKMGFVSSIDFVKLLIHVIAKHEEVK